MGARILRGVPDPPESWADLQERIADTRFGELRHLEEVDSTNRYLLDEARQGAAEGVVAVADHQTAGRGRLGRTWEAPPRASLLVSVLLRPDLEPARSHLATMAAGVAMVEAVWLTAGFTPSLKWPNDLVVGDRKLAGMLSEAELRDGRLDALVVGIGVNVNWDEFPPELAGTAVACNQVAGHPVDRAALLGAFLERLDDRYATLLRPGGDEAVLGEYRQRCSTIGREVRVELADDESLEGTATGVDDAGRLDVETRDGVTPVAVGDVVHLRPTDG